MRVYYFVEPGPGEKWWRVIRVTDGNPSTETDFIPRRDTADRLAWKFTITPPDPDKVAA